ncbi:YqbH/XkdH family protein [Bacillus swezeyi]|uniref:YqbH/XkdH family protein n=1 Tax=Bacillus swezeyi TaxID=1925020 RepID=UPI0039C5CCAC
MSYRKLLSDRCDIYHVKEEQAQEARYGVPAEDLHPLRTYEETPDAANVPCYFTERSQSMIQKDPEQVIYHSYLVHFPLNADIRLHDLVVWNGISYTLQKPKSIKGHHWEVLAVRDEKL